MNSGGPDMMLAIVGSLSFNLGHFEPVWTLIENNIFSHIFFLIDSRSETLEPYVVVLGKLWFERDHSKISRRLPSLVFCTGACQSHYVCGPVQTRIKFV